MVAIDGELWFNGAMRMQKATAIKLLGGTVAAAAKRIGTSYQAVNKWPSELPDRIADRVIAAIAREHLPPEILGADEAANGAAADALQRIAI